MIKKNEMVSYHRDSKVLTMDMSKARIAAPAFLQ